MAGKEISDMEESEWKSIISSRPFRFIVGPNKSEFTIHSALVAATSAPLRALVSGPMVEARTSRVVWDDISESTFVLFSQFVYTGGYASPKPTQEPFTTRPPVSQTPPSQAIHTSSVFSVTPRPATTTIEEVIDYSTDAMTRSRERVRGRMQRVVLGQYRSNDIYESPPRKRTKISEKTATKGDRLWSRLLAASGVSGDGRPGPMSQSRAHQNYSAALVAHARLYVLADRYQVSKLRTLSLSKLGGILCGFRLCGRRCKDVLAMLRFCYDDDLVPDKLKEIVALYAACEMETLWDDADFKRFYGEHQSFSSAVTGQLMFRLED